MALVCKTGCGGHTFEWGERKHIIVETLSPPALEIAANADSTVRSKDALELLDRQYGEGVHGYELYNQFRSCIQDVKGDYLQISAAPTPTGPQDFE